MSEQALAPRNAFHGVIAVWILAFLAAIAVGMFVPQLWQPTAVVIAFAGAVLVSFAVQLAYGLARGYIVRVAASIGGGLVVIAIVSLGFTVASFVQG